MPTRDFDNGVGVPIQEAVYEFQWPAIDAIVAGRSAIDLTGLRLATGGEADDFLRAYGFEPEDPADAPELEKVAELAAAFIEGTLLPYGDLKALPSNLPRDYRELLLLASTPDHPLRDWACAFLRVSHAVVHARYAELVDLLDPASDQIFARFKAHLRERSEGSVISDGEITIPLVRCDFKPRKPWESILLKLLHKHDAVAQEIYDHLGVRFVVPDKAYALLLLKYFRIHNIFSIPNIKPSRSVNTLVDLPDFKASFAELDDAYQAGELTFKEFTQAVHRLGKTPDAAHARNPHTSGGYQTIQFTVRSLVRIPYEAGFRRVLVPFEVQIMDAEGFEKTQAGEADHAAYRERQRQAVCKRVFPWHARVGEALTARVAPPRTP